MDLKDKKVTVVGLGNSGSNAAVLLDDIGAAAWATDAGDTPGIRRAVENLANRDIRIEIGCHTREFIEGSSLVVVSPGVEETSLPIRWARELGIPVIGEMELGFRFCKGKVIAITGTNGKSTVTTLTGEILRSGGKDVVVCGNIGNSLCGEIQRIKEGTLVVMEVSSFQLELTEKFKPEIAVILNITDDHLDRYRTFKDYFREKLRIFTNQDKDDILVLNSDAGNLRPLAGMARSKVLWYGRSGNVDGVYVKGDMILSTVRGREEELLSVRDIRLKGSHNLENVAASCLMGVLNGVDSGSIRKVVSVFTGLSHRFETVDTIEGVEYVDDSKGTTVDSTYRALESCDKPVILIAGGKDKKSDYGVIKDMVRKKAKHLVLIGEAAPKIQGILGDCVDTHNAKSMDDAVVIARGLAQRGMIVLLSPMCSSFDMFKDYKERGDIFRRAVQGIRAHPVSAKGAR